MGFELAVISGKIDTCHATAPERFLEKGTTPRSGLFALFAKFLKEQRTAEMKTLQSHGVEEQDSVSVLIPSAWTNVDDTKALQEAIDTTSHVITDTYDQMSSCMTGVAAHLYKQWMPQLGWMDPLFRQCGDYQSLEIDYRRVSDTRDIPHPIQQPTSHKQHNTTQPQVLTTRGLPVPRQDAHIDHYLPFLFFNLFIPSSVSIPTLPGTVNS